MIRTLADRFAGKVSSSIASIAVTVVTGAALAAPVAAGYFPMYSTWPQPGGSGTPITLEYSYVNLLDGGMLDGATLGPLDAELMRTAFEAALEDYTPHLPLHFVETLDAGPQPETGEYDPTGLPDIRIGQVPHVDGANAYAYFPNPGSGLAGDIVFNAQLSGFGWSPVFFYAVAQHELGHSLGMGHYVECDVMIEEAAQNALQESPYGGPQIPLSPDMIDALQAAYGSGEGSVTPLYVPEPGFVGSLAAACALLRIAGVRRARGRGRPRESRRRALRGSARASIRACALALPFVVMLSLNVSEASAISIVFDYRFDSAGFFDPETETGFAARAALEEAGTIGDLLGDSLDAISPAEGDSWRTGSFINPAGGGLVSVSDLVVPEDTMIVFVGGRPIGGVLGLAGSASIGAVNGDEAFIDTVYARGQAGALDLIPADFGPWGGSITFGSDIPWNFAVETGPAPDEQDFLTTATHELLHILGFGSAPSWDAQIEDGSFTGVFSTALTGGDVPLDLYGGHWAEGTMSTVGIDGLQETLMDPSTPLGVRQRATALDLAALRDIGWTVVPEPGTATLVSLGLMALASRPGRRRRPSPRASITQRIIQ